MTAFSEQCEPRIPEIGDNLLERMVAQIKPVTLSVVNGRQRFRLIHTEGVDRRGTAFTWEPKLGRAVRLYQGAGNSVSLLTLHTFGAPVLFKPSLAEVYACINELVPDWTAARFFWLQSDGLDRRSVFGGWHVCPCLLFGDEQQDVIDQCWEQDAAACGA